MRKRHNIWKKLFVIIMVIACVMTYMPSIAQYAFAKDTSTKTDAEATKETTETTQVSDSTKGEDSGNSEDTTTSDTASDNANGGGQTVVQDQPVPTTVPKPRAISCTTVSTSTGMRPMKKRNIRKRQ